MAKDDLLRESLEAFQEARDADQHNTREAAHDFKFYAGEQWPAEIVRDRTASKRPLLTINQLPKYLRSVTNDARQNPAGIMVRPEDDFADVETAKVLTGLIRNIEAQSKAQIAYIRALEHAVIGGLGHFRITTEYAADDAFEQDIRIRPIMSPFAVTWDHGARHPLRIDAERVWVTDLLTRSAFKARFPKATPSDWEAARIEAPDWHQGDLVRIAEYWYRKPTTKSLVLFADGQVADRAQIDDETYARWQAEGYITNERKVETSKICQVLMSGMDVLSDVTEWPGKHFPIIPVLGEEVDIGERQMRFGMVRFARDPQLMYNVHRTALAEAAAMAPKAKWIGTDEQFAGHEPEWDQANVSPTARLTYSPDPQAPGPPQRIAPDLPSQALVTEVGLAAGDLEGVIGIYRANLGAPSNETSGRAIRFRQREGDTGTFAYLDNLHRAIEQGGRVIVDILPRIYDTPRVARVLGEDGVGETVRLNWTLPDGRKIHDLASGKYDVAVTAGPAYGTRREEALEGMTEFVRAVPAAAMMVADLIAKNSDWPGSDEFAARFRRQLVAQGVAKPEEGDDPPPPPQPSPEMVLAQAEMVKAQATAERTALEARTRDMEAQNERIKLMIEVAKLEQQGVKIALDGIAKEQRASVDRAKVLVDAADKDARINMQARQPLVGFGTPPN